MKKTNLITSDLYFAAFLQSTGCKIVKTEPDGSKNVFHFEDDQGRENLKEVYFNEMEGSKVQALRYANAIRSLKTLCFVR